VSRRRVVVRAAGGSVRVDLRPLAVSGLLAALGTLALVLGVASGEVPIAVGDVLGSLAGSGDSATDFIVRDLRLPRALTALLAGAALGLSGMIFQQVTRNPLASPDVVGVSSGASLAAVALIVFGSPTGAAAVPLASLAGALAAGALLFALAGRGGMDGYRVVLVGIGLAALLQAGISYVLTRGRIFEVADAYVWLVGTVNARGWEHVRPLAAALLLLVPAAMVLARRLDALALGDDVAQSLGVAAGRSRAALLVVAVGLTGVAVAAAGPVGFVAFLAPHLARRLTRTGSAQALLPAAASCGAVLVVVSDLAGRVLFAPTEVPVGLITSVVAAPYFLLLLRRAHRIGGAG
jgi:iron complex transport system permease protein